MRHCLASTALLGRRIIACPRLCMHRSTISGLTLSMVWTAHPKGAESAKAHVHGPHFSDKSRNRKVAATEHGHAIQVCLTWCGFTWCSKVDKVDSRLLGSRLHRPKLQMQKRFWAEVVRTEHGLIQVSSHACSVFGISGLPIISVHWFTLLIC